MATSLAYLRLSYRKDRNGKLIEEKRDAITRQKKDMRELAADHEAELPDSAIYFEDDTSASKKRDESTQWAKLLIALEELKPDFLFATALDRLGRRLADLENLEEICKRTGTVVITKKEDEIFSLPYWPVLAALARMESINISIRMMRSQKARRETGKDSGGGNRAYGYAVDRMTVIKAEKKIILEIVERVLSGQTPNSIAIDLANRDVPTARGGQWSPTMVTRIARNPRYAGLQEHDGEVIGKAAWPAIITEAEHEALKAALDGKRHGTPASREAGAPRIVKGKEISFLSGMVECGVCGQPMIATVAGRNHNPIYRCSGPRGGRKGCGKVYRSRALVNDFVTEQILGNVDDTIIEAERRDIEAKLDPMNQEYGHLEIDITDLFELDKAKDIKALYERLNGRTYKEVWNELNARRATLSNGIMKLVKRMNEISGGTEPVRRWDSITEAERRAFMLSRIERVIVNRRGGMRSMDALADGDVEIKWRDTPDDYIPYLSTVEGRR